jgi:hypothetical protein
MRSQGYQEKDFPQTSRLVFLFSTKKDLTLNDIYIFNQLALCSGSIGSVKISPGRQKNKSKQYNRLARGKNTMRTKFFLTGLFFVFFFAVSVVVAQDSIAVKVMSLEGGTYELLLTGGKNIAPEDLYFNHLPEIGRIADTVVISYFVNLKRYKIGKRVFIIGSAITLAGIVLHGANKKEGAPIGVIGLGIGLGIGVPIINGDEEVKKNRATHNVTRKYFIYQKDIRFIEETIKL